MPGRARHAGKSDGLYANTPATGLFLDRTKPTYVGGILEMVNARLYRFWADLTEGLKTGEPQNEAKTGGDLFDALYQDPVELQRFLAAMTGLSLGAGQAIAAEIPVGRLQDLRRRRLRRRRRPGRDRRCPSAPHGHRLRSPAVKPHFDAFAARHGLADRLTFVGGDFFADPFPKADVVVMGHILHDWGLEKKKQLIAKAYDALPDGRRLPDLRAPDRRRAPHQHLRPPRKPQHADRDPRRL